MLCLFQLQETLCDPLKSGFLVNRTLFFFNLSTSTSLRLHNQVPSLVNPSDGPHLLVQSDTETHGLLIASCICELPWAVSRTSEVTFVRGLRCSLPFHMGSCTFEGLPQTLGTSVCATKHAYRAEPNLDLAGGDRYLSIS